jgi:hypothetical protein
LEERKREFVEHYRKEKFFIPETNDLLIDRFAAAVETWTEETLWGWHRWGIDEHTAWRVWHTIMEHARFAREFIHDQVGYDS